MSMTAVQNHSAFVDPAAVVAAAAAAAAAQLLPESQQQQQQQQQQGTGTPQMRSMSEEDSSCSAAAGSPSNVPLVENSMAPAGSSNSAAVLGNGNGTPFSKTNIGGPSLFMDLFSSYGVEPSSQQQQQSLAMMDSGGGGGSVGVPMGSVPPPGMGIPPEMTVWEDAGWENAFGAGVGSPPNDATQ
ncbi:hypothetical protein GGF46_003619 [Coemansia sp. RSA 552]|nr:hypothetical protein GGF46_003619 [Coemansia sp. RSA 552]